MSRSKQENRTRGDAGRGHLSTCRTPPPDTFTRLVSVRSWSDWVPDEYGHLGVLDCVFIEASKCSPESTPRTSEIVGAPIVHCSFMSFYGRNNSSVRGRLNLLRRSVCLVRQVQSTLSFLESQVSKSLHCPDRSCLPPLSVWDLYKDTGDRKEPK